MIEMFAFAALTLVVASELADPGLTLENVKAQGLLQASVHGPGAGPLDDADQRCRRFS